MKVDGREAGLAGRHTMWVPMIFVEGKDMELVIVEGELLNLNLLDLERLRESEKDFLWTWTIHSIRCSQRVPLHQEIVETLVFPVRSDHVMDP